MLDWLEQHQLPCFYHQVLGFECPACGFQRALILLLKGEWWASIQVYPALIPTLIILVLLTTQLILKKPGWKILNGLLRTDLALVLISWMVKWFV